MREQEGFSGREIVPGPSNLHRHLCISYAILWTETERKAGNYEFFRQDVGLFCRNCFFNDFHGNDLLEQIQAE